MRFVVRTLPFVLAAGLLVLAACAEKPKPEASAGKVYLSWHGEVFKSADEFRSRYKEILDSQLAAVTPVANRLGGRALIIAPDADRLRPAVYEWTNALSTDALNLQIEYYQTRATIIAEAIRRANLFDTVDVAVRNDTENPTDTGYSYIFRFEIGTTGRNHTGQWYGQWILRRGAGEEEEVNFDPGVSEPQRLVAFMRAIRLAAADIGGPAVPGLAPEKDATPIAALTGFAISADGAIVTNAHGLPGCSGMRVHVQSKTLPAQILAQDKENDLALLHVGYSFAAPIALRDGAAIRPADAVVAIGFPFGTLLGDTASVTSGTVSALAGMGNDSRLLQFTAPTQPGSSGSPLLDESGHVVGVVNSRKPQTLAAVREGEIPQNVNFAIKASVLREFLDSHGAKYGSAPSTVALRPAEMAEQARQAVVRLECLN